MTPMHPGPRNLITDIEGLRVGNSDDTRLKSGTTVLVGDAPFVASVDVMGGAPGTRETELLDPQRTVEAVDALVLSGGSAFGLDAPSGVSDGLRAMGRGFQLGPALIPIVPGAIIFDLLNGGDKAWEENPYRALGRAAFENASEDFALGSHGAGKGAVTGNYKGGLGSASLVMPCGTVVGALVAANPIGNVVTPNGHFHAAPFEIGTEFGGLGPDPQPMGCLPHRSEKVAKMMELAAGADQAPTANTTIAIVATDATLTKAQCKRMAVMAQDGLGRAIVPAHSPMDGDLIFAAATGKRVAPELSDLGHAAAMCLSRAIARAVWEARPEEGDVLPCIRN